MYSAEPQPWKAIKVEYEGMEGDDDLEEALYNASKHMSDHEPLLLWLRRDVLPNQKVAAGLMQQALQWGPVSGQSKTKRADCEDTGAVPRGGLHAAFS